MGAINVGSVSVDVLPDTSDFASRLRADLRDLPQVQIDVGADTTAARAAIDELGRNRDSRIDVNVDDALARAELDELSRDRTADLTIREHHVSDGGGGLGMLGIGALAAPLLAPLGAGALGGIAGIATAGVAGAAGLGVLTLGLSGVKNAIDAVGKAHTAAGAAAGSSANAQAAAAAAVQGAQANLSNAIAAADYASQQSAEHVANARQALADATRTAALGVSNALAQQVTAEQALQAAQTSATQAQQALTTARQQAQQQIQDLTLSVADGALAQRQANLSVIAAQQNYQAVLANPASTELQRAQAKLTYDQAVQQVTDLGVRQQRLQAQQAAAVKAGVDGSAVVVAAQGRITASQQNLINAQTRAAAAAAAVTEARRSGAEQVAKAEQAVTDAIRSQANQARTSAASIAAAQLAFQNAQRQAAVAAQGTGSAANAASRAMAGLTPAARQFAEFVIGTLEPALKRLKTAASAGLLPGLESGLKALMPIMPIFESLVASAAKAMGDLFAAAGKALSSPFFVQFFKDLSSSIGPNITNLGNTLGNIATGFAGLFQAFLPLGSSMGKGVADLTKKFADFATHLQTNTGFQKFLTYIKTEGPVVVSALGHLLEVVGKLLVALAPLGVVMLKVVDDVAKLLAKMGPGQLIAVVAAVTTGISLMMLAFDVTPVGLLITAIAALAAGLVYAYEHSKTFRDIVDGAMHVVGVAIGFVADHWKAFAIGFGILAGPVFLVLSLIVTHFSTFKSIARDVLKFVADAFLGMAGSIIHAAAFAFGWVPGIGPKLKAAAKEFDKFAASVNAALDTITPVKTITLQALISGPGGATVAATIANVHDRTGTGGHAFGGPIIGPGSGLSDSINVPLSNGEHVWTAAEVAAAGGHGAVEALRHAALAHALGSRSSSLSASGGVGGGTPSVGQLVINNPVPEKAVDSVAVTMRRLQYVLGT